MHERDGDMLAATMSSRGHAIGAVLADRYVLRAHLGSGGMGAVYRAYDRELDEEVALKILHFDLLASEHALVRFRREVKLARRVTHPSVARTFDLGVHPGMRFLTMELIEGEALRSRTGVQVPLPEALRIVASIARGLAAAHGQGVTHRDLKPENVLLSGERVVVTDFGIARSEADAGVTQDAIIGTPAYMAPEQVEARGVDGRSDVFALGVVAYELLTGRLPFEAATPLAMAFARIMSVAPDARDLRSGLPDGVAALVRAMLERPKEARPDAQTVADRVDELRGVAGAHAPHARSTTPVFSQEILGGFGVARTISVAPVDAPAILAAQAGDLTRALTDMLAVDSRIRVVPSSAELCVSADFRVSGDRARVRWRLSSRSGVTLVAGHEDGTSSDPFSLEDRVVARVLEAVKQRVLSRRGPADERLRARWDETVGLLMTGDDASMRRAIEALESLHSDAPNDAVIMAALAVASVRLLMSRGDLDEVAAARAEELALRARDADPSLPEAYQAIAMVRASFGDWRAAFAAAREVAMRNPGFAEVHIDLGRLLSMCGLMSEGLSRIELGLRLGPTGVFAARVVHARSLFLAGQLERCGEVLETLRASSPSGALAELELRLILWRGALQRGERAPLEAIAEVFSARGGLWADVGQLLVAHARGERCLELLEALVQRLRSGRLSVRSRMYVGALIVELFAQHGETDRALTQLEETTEPGWFVDLGWLDAAPTLGPLRSSPRFAAVRARMAIRAADIVA